MLPIDASWTPAHTVAADVGVRRSGDGSLLSAHDRLGTEEVYRLAKEAAREHRVAAEVFRSVRRQKKRVSRLVWWGARATLYANDRDHHACVTPSRPCVAVVRGALGNRRQGQPLRRNLSSLVVIALSILVCTAPVSGSALFVAARRGGKQLWCTVVALAPPPFVGPGARPQ